MRLVRGRTTRAKEQVSVTRSPDTHSGPPRPAATTTATTAITTITRTSYLLRYHYYYNHHQNYRCYYFFYYYFRRPTSCSGRHFVALAIFSVVSPGSNTGAAAECQVLARPGVMAAR